MMSLLYVQNFCFFIHPLYLVPKSCMWELFSSFKIHHRYYYFHMKHTLIMSLLLLPIPSFSFLGPHSVHMLDPCLIKMQKVIKTRSSEMTYNLLGESERYGSVGGKP